MNKTLRYATINSIGTALYISSVVSFIYFLGRIFDNVKSESVIIPIAMLMLFVFSAAFTGILVLGRPIIWYLEGKKRAALSLLFYTLGILFLITVITFLFLMMFQSI